MRNLVAAIATVAAVIGAQNGLFAHGRCTATECDGLKVIYETPHETRIYEKAHKFTEAELRLLADTIWMEARSGGVNAMAAVGHVIINRMNATGKSLAEVIMAPHQFSCWHLKSSRRALANLAHLDDRDQLMHQKAMALSPKLLKGIYPDTTHGAKYYHATYVHPCWSKKMRQVAFIGGHKFFRG